MTIITMKSDEARSRFRDILDHVFGGLTEVVIERYNKPTAVVVNYHEWQKLKELQKQQRKDAIARARREMDAGHYFTAEQVEIELSKRGLLN